MVFVILGLSIIVIVLGYVIYNLLRKLETAEDILYSYLEYLDKISRIIEISDKKLKEIDHKGSFQSDDEVGFIFKQIKEIQNILSTFILK
jgi:hypothetical protein